MIRLVVFLHRHVVTGLCTCLRTPLYVPLVFTPVSECVSKHRLASQGPRVAGVNVAPIDDLLGLPPQIATDPKPKIRRDERRRCMRPCMAAHACTKYMQLLI